MRLPTAGIFTVILGIVLLSSFCTAPQKKKPQNNKTADSELNDDDYFNGKTAKKDLKEDKLSSEAKDFLEDEGFIEEGYASWYGKKYNGHPTSSGEIFDMNKLTAAHRTLAFGTIVLVRNLENNHEVQVKINDRGPFVDGRIIDVSFAAAKKLDILKKGYAKVKLKVISEQSAELAVKDDDFSDDDELSADDDDDVVYEKPPVSQEKAFIGSVPKGYTVQVGAFKQEKNAQDLKEKLKAQFDEKIYIAKQGSFYIVWVGSFKSKAEAMNLKKLIKNDGGEAFVYKAGSGKGYM